MPRPLTQDEYATGTRCRKALSLRTHRRELLPAPSDAVLSYTESTRELKRIARRRFPMASEDGPPEGEDAATAHERTATAMRNGVDLIVDARIEADGVSVVVDLLRREGDEWCVYQVFSSTKPKPHQHQECALLLHTLTAAGLSVRDIAHLHVDTSYERQGDIDPYRLFHEVSVLDLVQDLQEPIRARLDGFRRLLLSSDIPDVALGSHCDHPFPCEFKQHCSSGVAAAVSGERRVMSDSLRHYLNSLRYPLHCLDFETVASPVPLFEGSRPYEQIPFQFSVHRQDAPDGPVTHISFLADGTGDPRAAFADALCDAIGPDGDILAYYVPFESKRLAEIEHRLPDRGEALATIRSRMKDLRDPFNYKWYVDPATGGSTSIKAVLPALVPEMSYADLQIRDGETASRRFLELLRRPESVGAQQVRHDLLQYCARDTEAMVRILGVLRRSI